MYIGKYKQGGRCECFFLNNGFKKIPMVALSRAPQHYAMKNKMHQVCDIPKYNIFFSFTKYSVVYDNDDNRRNHEQA